MVGGFTEILIKKMCVGISFGELSLVTKRFWHQHICDKYDTFSVINMTYNGYTM